MLHQLPKHTPPLSVMLGDIGNPTPMQLAGAFKVHERTVRRWVASDKAPRSVMLALYWLTRWGVSQVHCQAHNDAVLQASIARCLQSTLDEALDKIEHLERIGSFGAANDPTPARQSRRGIEAVGAHAQALLDREKTRWIGEEVKAPAKAGKKTEQQKRAERAKRRLAKRATGIPQPFDFLRVN